MKRRLVVLAFLGFITCMNLEAKYKKVRSEKKFNNVLDENALVVVMFYRKSEDMRDQVRDFKAAGKEERNVTFASVDLDDPDLTDLGDLYEVGRTPYFMLFRNGVTYNATLSGRKGVAAIGKFVRKNFNKYLRRIRRRKRERAEENRPSVSFGLGYGGYPYSPYYYGSPYYGGYYGYPYYRRPGFSFGIGF